jgi:hypothetical protein
MTSTCPVMKAASASSEQKGGWTKAALPIAAARAGAADPLSCAGDEGVLRRIPRLHSSRALLRRPLDRDAARETG